MKKTRREIHGGNKIMKKVKGEWVAALCAFSIVSAPVAMTTNVLAEVPATLSSVYSDEYASNFDKKDELIEEAWVQAESQKAVDLITEETKTNTVEQIKDEIKRQEAGQKEAKVDLPIYVIQFGDELPKIADAYDVDATKLAEDNQLKDPNKVVVGDILTISKEAKEVAKVTEVTTDVKPIAKPVVVKPGTPVIEQEESKEHTGETQPEKPVEPKPEVPIVTEEPKPTNPTTPTKPETTVEVPIEEETVTPKPEETTGEVTKPEETTVTPKPGETTVDVPVEEITPEETSVTPKPEETTGEVTQPTDPVVDDHGPNSVYQGLHIGDKVLARTVNGQDIYWTVKDFYMDQTVTLDEANASKTLIKDDKVAAVIYEDENGQEQVFEVPLSDQSVAKFNDGTYLDMNVVRNKLLGLVNNLRKTNGLNELVLNKDLNYAAEVRTDEMVVNGSTRFYVDGDFKAHVRDDQGTDINTVFKDNANIVGGFGENTASTPVASASTDLVNEDYVANYFYGLWENSAAHKTNMLGTDYKYMGFDIGVSDKQRSGVNEYRHVTESMIATMTLAGDGLYKDPSKVVDSGSGEWEYVGELTPVETPTTPVTEVTPTPVTPAP